MPPPAKPNLNSRQRPSHRTENGQYSSAFFARTTEDRATGVASDTAKKRRLESDDEANKPSILPEQAFSTNKRNSKDSRGKFNVRFQADKAVKSFAMQIVGDCHDNSSDVGPGQLPSTDLDLTERSLYDRVSRKEASTFVTAKNYGHSVEKRRKLGD